MPATNSNSTRQAASAAQRRSTLSLPSQKPTPTPAPERVKSVAPAAETKPAPTPSKGRRFELNVDGAMVAFRWQSLTHVITRTSSLSIEARLVVCAIVAHAIWKPRKAAPDGALGFLVRPRDFDPVNLARRLGLPLEEVERAIAELVEHGVMTVWPSTRAKFLQAEITDAFIVACHRRPSAPVSTGASTPEATDEVSA